MACSGWKDTRAEGFTRPLAALRGTTRSKHAAEQRRLRRAFRDQGAQFDTLLASDVPLARQALRKISLSHVFAGQTVGIREVADKIWLVSFMHYDLGFFDHETGRVECADIPSRQNCYPCPRNNPSPKCPERTLIELASPRGFEPRLPP